MEKSPDLDHLFQKPKGTFSDSAQEVIDGAREELRQLEARERQEEALGRVAFLPYIEPTSTR